MTAPKLLRALLLVAALAAPLALPPAAAPLPKEPIKPYALIFGTVYTPDDRPAYGATVRIRRAEDKKARWELISDHQGEFAQRVPAGAADYVLSADFKAQKVRLTAEKKVHIESDERVDITLHLVE